MSPIYIPPLYCGVGAILQLIKDYSVDCIQISKGKRCTVTDVIGYKYEIVFDDLDITTRIYNSELLYIFDVISVGKKHWIEEDIELIKRINPSKLILNKDLVIKDVVTFQKGKSFYAISEKSNDGKNFWNLYDVTTFERLLRLKDSEVKEYFISRN